MSDADLVEQTVIRQAQLDDVPLLVMLRRRWTVETGAADDSTFPQRYASWHQAEQSRRRFWLAEIEGEAIGMVNLVVFDRMPRPRS